MGNTRRTRRALTALELLATTCALAALASLMGAAAHKARNATRTADCLSNLHQIGLALHAYANEDPREQAIPMHMNMVQPVDYWLWRTANWYAWGGQAATLPFLTSTSTGAGYWLSDAPPPDGPYTAHPEYATDRRPLNGYLAPDALDVFHCPQDTGYPLGPHVDDVPLANANRACWDTYGNSYRANMACYANTGAGNLSAGNFAFGPWGHRLSTLTNQSRLILLGDPLWFNQLGDPNSIDPNSTGWHGIALSDNLLYCDGSARLTSTTGRAPRSNSYWRRPQPSDLLRWDRPQPMSSGLLAAGPSWQMDCYPTPGSVIWGNWSNFLGSNTWPWKNAYLNPGAARDAAVDPQDVVFID